MQKEAHDLLCRILAPANAFPDCDLGPDDPRWPVLFQLADANMVLPQLLPQIKDKGLNARLPEPMQTALDEVAALMEAHSAALLAQMHEINAAFAQADILPIWLKGAALMSEPEGQRRPRLMTDLDVWVASPEKQPEALAVLSRLGYQTEEKAVSMEWGDSHHYPPLFHPQQPMRLELHRHIVRKVFSGLLPNAQALEKCEYATLDGLPIARLALPDRIMHSLIQCSLMSTPPIATGQVKLMKLLDLARLISRTGQHAFPEEVVKRLAVSPMALRKPIQRFLTLFERDFLVKNPFCSDAAYCNAVDYFLKHGRAVPAAVVKQLLQPPGSWRRLLSEPGQIGSKIARRVRYALNLKSTTL